MNIALGAGIAGLGAYYANNDITLFESSNQIGGLCSGFEVDGYHFDKAVHLSFTTNQLVRNVFDDVEYFKHKPESLSWFHEQWLRHPAQNNLYPCNIEDKIAAIKGFAEKSIGVSDDFESWSKGQYGEWLYENMFRPYNTKYWCINLKELGVKWIGNRIYQPTIDEILFGALTDKTPNTYYAKEMRYPVNGGYYEFIKKIGIDATKNNKLFLNKRVVSINPEQKKVVFSDNTDVKYDRCYSSIPLREMGSIISNMPSNLVEKVNQLEYTSVALVSIGFNKIIDFDRMWFYIYDEDILAARAYLPSLKSPNNAPTGCSSIQFEIYFNANNLAPSKDSCIDNCLYALRKFKLADETDVAVVDYRVLPYGNIIFKHGTEETAEEVTGWLKNNGINPIGRFGEWKYLWSDQAFLSGYNTVKENE